MLSAHVKVYVPSFVTVTLVAALLTFAKMTPAEGLAVHAPFPTLAVPFKLNECEHV